MKNRDIILGPQGEPLEPRYSPDQPRDEHGRFGSGSGMSKEDAATVQDWGFDKTQYSGLNKSAALGELLDRVPDRFTGRVVRGATMSELQIAQLKESKTLTLDQHTSATANENEDLAHIAAVESTSDRPGGFVPVVLDLRVLNQADVGEQLYGQRGMEVILKSGTSFSLSRVSSATITDGDGNTHRGYRVTGSQLTKARSLRFDPDQPREANGEWGSGGEGATKTEDPERATRVAAARSALEQQMNVHDGAPKETVATAIAMMSEKISPDTVRAAGWLEVYKLDNTSSKLGDGFKTNGSYNFQNRTIDTRANVGTFIHEYGHHITSRLDFNKPEGVDPKAYRAVKDAAINEFRVATGVGPKDAAVGIGARWTKITPAEARRAPSAYALTNFKEWQAESFMMYMQGGKHEERLQKVAPQTYKYINSIVRNSYK